MDSSVTNRDARSSSVARRSRATRRANRTSTERRFAGLSANVRGRVGLQLDALPHGVGRDRAARGAVRRRLPRPARGARAVGGAGRAVGGPRHAPGHLRRGLRLRRRAVLGLRCLVLCRLQADDAVGPQRARSERRGVHRSALHVAGYARALHRSVAARGRCGSRGSRLSSASTCSTSPSGGRTTSARSKPTGSSRSTRASLKVVRAEAPRWLAFLEPGASRNLGFATGADAVSVLERRVRAALVRLDRRDFGCLPGGGRALRRGEDRRALEKEAQSLGAALWVGEYGGQWNDPNIGSCAWGRNTRGSAPSRAGAGISGTTVPGWIQPSRGGREREYGARECRRAPLSVAHCGGPGLVRVRRGDEDVHVRVPARRERHGADRDRGAESRLPDGVSRRVWGCTSKVTATGVEIDRPGSGAQVTVTLAP